MSLISITKSCGIIIIVGECRDGLGEGNFAEALNGKLSPYELIEELKRNFVLGRHKASRIANINLNTERIKKAPLRGKY